MIFDDPKLSETTRRALARASNAAINQIKHAALRALIVGDDEDEQTLIQLARMYTRMMHDDFRMFMPAEEPSNEHQDHPLVRKTFQHWMVVRRTEDGTQYYCGNGCWTEARQRHVSHNPEHLLQAVGSFRGSFFLRFFGVPLSSHDFAKMASSDSLPLTSTLACGCP